MRIAVAGNPNSGKTSLWNRITGSRARVGNYPGVTVERKEASRALPGGRTATFVDLPGCYSLVARSPEEEVAHHVLLGKFSQQKPDLVVCVVDATNLARGLYLALQLRELDLPVVLALNMIDVAIERGMEIDTALLERRLGFPVVATSARHGTGIDELLQRIAALTRDTSPSPFTLALSPADQDVINRCRSELLALGQPASFGAATWLLTSNLREVRGLSEAEVELAHTLRRQVDGSLSRRLITARYQVVDEVVDGVVTRRAATHDLRTERIDRVLLHPILGLAIFALAMFVLFQAVFAWAEPMIGAIEGLMGWLAAHLEDLLPPSLTRSLLVDGVIAGVGNVLVFLPQIALLFLGLTLLEESGYLARAAFLLDRLMRKVGLHGKAFVPMMSGFACAVPAVMAARTVESSRDRLVTILVTPFMSCSARLPIYVLVVAAVLANAPPVLGVLSLGGVVVACMYLLGFSAAIVTAFLLKRTVLRAPPPPFILELPSYKLPRLLDVLRHVFERCRVFVTSTGAVILALSMILWALLTFPERGLEPSYLQAERARITALPREQQEDATLALEQMDRQRRLESSLGGRIGRVIEPVIEPLGFDWRIGIGLVASFAAREVLVSTLGQVYALGSDVEPDSPALRDALLADKDPSTGRPRFSPLVGVSLMVFFVLAMQCLSTFAAVRRETNSWKWPLLQLAYMNALAYSASLLVFQTGQALGIGA